MRWRWPKIVKVSEKTRQDAISPTTGPLLRFFQGFARDQRDYSDVIKTSESKTLWGIGGKELLRPCPSSGQGLGYESSVESPLQDESEQHKAALLKIVNGPGLEAVTSAPSVGQLYFHTHTHTRMRVADVYHRSPLLARVYRAS